MYCKLKICIINDAFFASLSREVQSDVCRLILARRQRRGKKAGKKEKNVEKIRSLPGEGREFISETPFDFPGRNPFEESRYPSSAPL